MHPADAQPAVDEAAAGVTAVDAVPLLLTTGEWRDIAAGLVQRVRALEAFLDDAHGPRRTERDGLIASSHYFEPGVPRPPKRWLAVTGHDLVRDTAGRWWVLEDNVRTPGLLYGVAARHAVAAAGAAPPAPALHAALGVALRAALHGAAPVADPRVVALVDADAPGPTRHEVRALAAMAGAAVATHADLRTERGRLLHEDRPVDVVWHRTAEDRLRGDDGTPTALGAVLLEALEAGTVAVVNAPGSGLADDKRTGAHVPALIRALLGEAPRLAQPPAPADGEGAVLKARASAGGRGVVMAPGAPPGDPEGHIWQARVDVRPELVVTGHALEPRAVDLRAHVLVGDAGAVAIPSAGRHGAAGESRVNTSQGGGVKAVVIR